MAALSTISMAHLLKALLAAAYWRMVFKIGQDAASGIGRDACTSRPPA